MNKRAAVVSLCQVARRSRPFDYYGEGRATGFSEDSYRRRHEIFGCYSPPRRLPAHRMALRPWPILSNVPVCYATSGCKKEQDDLNQSSELPNAMEPWGFEPQIQPCHGRVIPFHYGPGIYGKLYLGSGGCQV